MGSTAASVLAVAPTLVVADPAGTTGFVLGRRPAGRTPAGADSHCPVAGPARAVTGPGEPGDYLDSVVRPGETVPPFWSGHVESSRRRMETALTGLTATFATIVDLLDESLNSSPQALDAGPPGPAGTDRHRGSARPTGRQLHDGRRAPDARRQVGPQRGADALEELDGRTIHLIIISDVNMPTMDGITLVREVNKLPSHRLTPVIMLTTGSDERRKHVGPEAGARAWVVKPFAPARMLAAVSELVLP